MSSPVKKTKAILQTKGIYAITDCDNLSVDDLLFKTEQILNAGVSLLQYRNKDKDRIQKKELAKRLKSLCEKYHTPFIVNDDLEIAKDVGADGIHLGKHDEDIHIARKALGSKIIGVSCYNDLNRAITAQQNGADYVAFGSFFPSITKPDAKKATRELLLKAKDKLTIPVVAIGGITPENGKDLVAAKADFLAVISGLYSADDAINVTKNYNNIFKRINYDN